MATFSVQSSGLHAPQNQKLRTLLSEYEDSLIRSEAETDIRQAIALQAKKDCACTEKDFKLLAVALHTDALKKTRDMLENQVALFNRIMADS